MVTALQDLSNRIASNTLTGPQQAALVQALALIIPTFPEPDEIGNSIPQTEGALARAWISALYTLQAEAGAGGGTTVLPTQQIAWFIDPVNGKDTNAGTTSGAPLKTLAALAALWKGTVGGGRPVLSPSTGSTITVHLLNDVPASDPLAPILDVDIDSPGSAPTQLIIQGAAKTSAHAGTMSSASVFARTSAGGQIKITDATVPDYSVFSGVASLFTEATTGAIAWLYAPSGSSSATGTLSVGYSPQTVGVVTPPTQTTITNGDNYTLADVTHCSFGSGFVTRTGPLQSTSVTGTPASVVLYRVHLSQPNDNDTLTMISDTAGYTLQECQIDHQIDVVAGTFTTQNCLWWDNLGAHASGSGVVALLAGALQGNNTGTVTAQGGGVVDIDLDFAVASGAAIEPLDGGTFQIGNASFWGNGSSPAALGVSGGRARFLPLFGSGTVFYGKDDGTPIVIVSTFSNGGSVLYHNDGTGTPTQNQFQFTHSIFQVGKLTSAFGFNSTTGAFVGPTTNTFAHLDAALAAGTGFGGEALDPGTGCFIRIEA